MAERPQALTAGTLLDGMTIERLVAQGPVHAVYRASDPALGRSFAIKEYLPAGLCERGADGVVRPLEGREEAFATGLERFREQARRAATVDHPGLAETIRLGEGHGTAWLVMRWYEGRPLQDMLRADADHDMARAMALQLMDAVQHLHEHGLVHRDIKPGNIIVRDDGSLVLVDFDAVAELGGEGPRLGSDGYAAPELYEDDAAVGPPADVYAVAATLYRCLTGERPPPADHRKTAVAAGEPDPLPEPKRRLPLERYGGLGDALAQGLDLDPARRPPDVAGWRKAYEALDWRLQRGDTDESGEFAPEARERLPLILLAALVLALLGIAWFLISGRDVTLPELPPNEARTADDAESVAEAPARPASDREREQWRAALEADTVEAYRRFLEAWPDSRYREQARIQLDILDERAWQNLSGEDTLPAYRDYLEQFPEGLHQADALRRIDEIEQARARAERERMERQRRDDQAWQAALDERSVASMERYLADWPAGAQVEEAQRIRRQLLDRANDEEAWRTATRLDTLDAYQAYLDAFPGGEYATAALQALDRNTLRPGKIFRDCERCPELIVVPAGTFRQGSEATAPDATPLEQPARQVTITRPFAAGMYEVTLDEWDFCVEEGGCKERPADNGWGRGRRPAMMVSWNDAQQYLAWLAKHSGETYRLPSESEWEYLARAGTRGDWLFEDPALVCEFGNVAGMETDFRWRHEACADPVALGTLPAGNLRPNDFGLFDVIGNVAEWTADCMNLSYIDAPADGSAWTRGICSSHMARGGSWVTGTRDIRLAARFHLKSGDRNDFTGFRVVREIDE